MAFVLVCLACKKTSLLYGAATVCPHCGSDGKPREEWKPKQPTPDMLWADGTSRGKLEIDRIPWRNVNLYD